MIELDNVRFEANPKNVSTLELWKENGRWHYGVMTPDEPDGKSSGTRTTEGYKYRGVAIRNAVMALEDLLAKFPHE